MTGSEARMIALLRAMDKAKTDYRSFLSLVFPHWAHAAHHRLIISELQKIVPGAGRRLMFFMPPGSAKSTYANGRFCPWYLAAHPESSVILATHTGDFAKKWGRRSRAVASSPSFRSVFGFGVDQRVQAADSWMLENRSEYMSAGVGMAVTGNRADLIVIDDPVKGREDADSITIRDKTWDWYNEDLWTRLKPGGSIVLIMTRWHEDDLAGRLLAAQERGGEKWDVIKLCAEAEEGDPLGRPLGEPLWPEWFRSEMFAQAKTQPRMWTALYQQRPAPEEGSYFQRDWFKFYDRLPDRLRYYGASDYAVTADGGDYTVHIVAGVSEQDDLYIVDMWREQTDALEWVDSLMGLFRAYKPQIWAEEGGVILKSLDPIIRKRVSEERLYGTFRKPFSSVSDKPTRARSLQGRIQMGKVFFPSPGLKTWVADLMGEFLTFPQGKHDDMVDACSLLCRMLDTMTAPAEIKHEPSLAERVQKMAEYKPTFNDLLKESQRMRSNAEW